MLDKMLEFRVVSNLMKYVLNLRPFLGYVRIYDVKNLDASLCMDGKIVIKVSMDFGMCGTRN